MTNEDHELLIFPMKEDEQGAGLCARAKADFYDIIALPLGGRDDGDIIPVLEIDDILPHYLDCVMALIAMRYPDLEAEMIEGN